ncbi:hypothetical protein [Micromonospora sp. NPDC000668]|uniref:hypothetical protein n=1 Tax=Micromonospora sp. NPDC000668 TaxID=3364219 RepID=UPI003685C35C
MRLLHRDFLAGREPDLARARAQQAIEEVNQASAEDIGFCGKVLASRLRLAISEVLQASGVLKAEANRQAGLTADAS